MADEDRKITVSLATIARGSAMERFEDALAEVVENITDPNTDAEEKRKITLDIVFDPSPERMVVGVQVLCKTKLAPPSSTTSVVYVGRDRAGKAYAHEYNPEQMSLSLGGKEEEPAPPARPHVVGDEVGR
jgi:hypothetical protein